MVLIGLDKMVEHLLFMAELAEQLLQLEEMVAEVEGVVVQVRTLAGTAVAVLMITIQEI